MEQEAAGPVGDCVVLVRLTLWRSPWHEPKELLNGGSADLRYDGDRREIRLNLGLASANEGFALLLPAPEIREIEFPLRRGDIRRVIVSIKPDPRELWPGRGIGLTDPGWSSLELRHAGPNGDPGTTLLAGPARDIARAVDVLKVNRLLEGAEVEDHTEGQ